MKRDERDEDAATVLKRGQITIPAAVRKVLKLKPKSTLFFVPDSLGGYHIMGDEQYANFLHAKINALDD